jgi:hypothetical protein
MKKFIAATALTLAFAAPAAADLTPEQVEELLAMSNESAAERMVAETGEPTDGNPMKAEIKFALGEMSAAERKAFFEADDQTRMELVAAKRQLKDGDSPAESAAIGTASDS